MHKILKTSSTRWLSLQSVVDRIIEQWVALKYYFVSFELESKDLAHNISSEMTDENMTYFYFISYILNITNKINIEYQSEEPKIHVLLPTIKIYYKTILSNFIKREYIDSVDKIDFSNSDFYLEMSEIYIGAKAGILLSKGTLKEEKIKEIKKVCCAYYAELCKQISSRIDFEDEVLVAVQSINPKNSVPSLAPLIKVCPHLIENDIQLQELDDEWRNFLHQDIVDKNLKLEEF